MGLHTGIGRLVPALALGAGDDADRLLFRFEDRPLLDMRPEIGLGRPIADSLALVADALQLLAEALALDVRAAVDVVQVEDSGEGAGAHHRRRDTRAILVGPDDALDRRLGLDAP